MKTGDHKNRTLGGHGEEKDGIGCTKIKQEVVKIEKKNKTRVARQAQICCEEVFGLTVVKYIWPK